MVDTEETPQFMERGHDAPEPAAERDIQMEKPLISCATQI
jgi:hypothetical protein